MIHGALTNFHEWYFIRFNQLTEIKESYYEVMHTRMPQATLHNQILPHYESSDKIEVYDQNNVIRRSAIEKIMTLMEFCIDESQRQIN